jgi:hypothetical protein
MLARKRFLAMSLAAAVLGAASTAGIAWTLALIPSQPSRDGYATFSFDPLLPDGPEPRTAGVIEERRRGVHTWHLVTMERSADGSEGPAWQFYPSPIAGTPVWLLRAGDDAQARRAMERDPVLRVAPWDPRHPRRAWPAWLPPIPPNDGLLAYGGRAAGWPLPVLRSVMFADATRASHWRGALRLRPALAYAASLWNIQDPESGCIPLEPVPLPFAISTVAWGVPWLALLMVPGLLRRAFRRRRGRCPRCGYDLQHDLASGCPECGWGREHNAVALCGTNRDSPV